MRVSITAKGILFFFCNPSLLPPHALYAIPRHLCICIWLLLVSLQFLEFYISRIKQIVFFFCQAFFFLPNIIMLRVTHILFAVIFNKQYSILWISFNLFIHPYVEGQLDSLRIYKYNCCEHLCTSLCMNMCFTFSQVNIQEWNDQVIWYRHFENFKETAKMLSKLVVTFLFPPVVYDSSSVLGPHQRLVSSVFLILSILISSKHSHCSPSKLFFSPDRHV